MSTWRFWFLATRFLGPGEGGDWQDTSGIIAQRSRCNPPPQAVVAQALPRHVTGPRPHGSVQRAGQRRDVALAGKKWAGWVQVLASARDPSRFCQKRFCCQHGPLLSTHPCSLPPRCCSARCGTTWMPSCCTSSSRCACHLLAGSPWPYHELSFWLLGFWVLALISLLPSNSADGQGGEGREPGGARPALHADGAWPGGWSPPFWGLEPTFLAETFLAETQ